MNNKNIFKLTKNNPKENLEKYLRPQWSWKTITFIISTIALLTVVTIDLEINFINLFTDSFKYFADILSRMLPPDFSNFNELVFSMIETIEIAILGTFIAIVLSIPLALLSAKKFVDNDNFLLHAGDTYFPNYDFIPHIINLYKKKEHPRKNALKSNQK